MILSKRIGRGVTVIAALSIGALALASGGVELTDLTPATDKGTSGDIAADGSLVTAGYANKLKDIGLTIHDSNGTLVGSSATADWGGTNNVGQAVLALPSGKFLVGGYKLLNKGGKITADFALLRFNSNGTPDKTLKTSTAFGSNAKSILYDLALQSDGKIIAVGDTNSTGQGNVWGIVRYTSTGALDPTFGFGGKLALDVSPIGPDFAYGVALQDDGRIVVVGAANGGTSGNFAVGRFNTDGSLDSSFGNAGIVFTNLDEAHDVAIQDDGRIVVCGSHGWNPVVVRYNTDGSLDLSFNGTGIATIPSLMGQVGATDLAIQDDGKIVFVSWSGLGRLNADGSLDTAFGSGGIVGAPFSQPEAVRVQGDGKIVIFGGGFGIARYNSDGSLDSGF